MKKSFVKRSKNIIFPVATAVVILLCALFCGADAAQKELAGSVVRLHVVANSDNAEDQSLKLAVRDAVLDVCMPLISDAADAAEAADTLEKHREEIVCAAEKTASALGYDYGAAASVAVEPFPTCEYDGFALPAGEYTALRVVIGEGKGHNWWCVVYPPLCRECAESKTEAALMLGPRQHALITGESGGYVVKFKTIELLNRLKQSLK